MLRSIFNLESIYCKKILINTKNCTFSFKILLYYYFCSNHKLRVDIFMKALQAKEILQDHNIKPSLHRLRILQYLLDNRTHPTVDIIYKDIIDEIPTLSKTTIYNTLKTFMEKNVVLAITIEDNEVRFDAYTHDHGHFKCTSCGSLYDVELKGDKFKIDTIDGHKVLEKHLYFKGICKSCSAH